MSRNHRRVLALAWLFAVLPAAAAAQQILLDKPVRAGELIAFPDLNDETKYYYVPDKPRLATDAQGRPQFSFLRYVENVRSGADQPEVREGEGGGIVHALVSLSVTPEQLRAAQQEVRRVKPGATLVGPVVFKSGKFGLVSSFRDPAGKLTTQVVGLGSAPLLDGEKAAVSMQLTKQGAKILWESFQTPTPDISFSFEMDVSGFLSPLRATIEAEWDQVYAHRSFGVGFASTYLAAEIKAAFDDLVRTGAIRVRQVGADAQMEAILSTAYNKLLEAMFEPIGGTGTPSLDALTSAGAGQSSLLERAGTMLQRNQDQARADNREVREENEAARKRNEELSTKRRAASEAERLARLQRDRVDEGKQRLAVIRKQIERIQARADRLRSDADAARAEATQLLADAGEDPAKKQAADAAAARADLLEARLRAAESQIEVLNVTASEAETAAADQEKAAATAEKEAATARSAAPDREADTPLREERDVPGFAVIASFEMKKIRQRGKFLIDLNKYNTDQRTLRFDENIGDLRRLFGDAQHFRQVNLDDPLFRQREIVAFLDGFNAQDFGSYINFVTVRMRKKHGGGTETNDEVRIDRTNFSKEGNAFKLLYGWNEGDNDRRRWMDYEYQPVWSFFGGHAVEEPWKKTSAGAIALAPPYHRRIVTLEAAPDAIATAQVRSITVKVFYKLGQTEQTRQVTLNASKNQLSEKIEFFSLPNDVNYDYEIVWRLTGNRTVTSGRKTASDAMLFVDELPTSSL